MRAVALALMLAVAAPPAATTAETRAAETEAAAFDELARELVPICVNAAATRCFETAFARADADGDEQLGFAEIDGLRRAATEWFLAERDRLTVREQTVIAMGLAALNTAGVERLIAAYDADGDGRLDRAELTADVVLDERPLPQLVRDEEAVDWAAVRGRLGSVAGALLPVPE
jgi:hypothetical protein